MFPTEESYKGIGVGAANTKLILVEHPHAILCTIFKLHLGCCIHTQIQTDWWVQLLIPTNSFYFLWLIDYSNTGEVS